MKALTLWQPWASLVALGVKTIETRSWSTSYRGPLAIHAAKKRPVHCSTVGAWQVLDQADAIRLAGPPLYDLGPMPVMPLGAVVATCTLVDVVPISATADDGDTFPLVYVTPKRPPHFLSTAPYPELVLFRDPIQEGEAIGDQLPYGDFSPGRYAWLLADIEPLAEPVPAKGRQGLWAWTA